MSAFVFRCLDLAEPKAKERATRPTAERARERASSLGEPAEHEMIAAEVERQQVEAQTYLKEMGRKVGGRIAPQNVSPYRRATSWRELGKLTRHIAPLDLGSGARHASRQGRSP